MTDPLVGNNNDFGWIDGVTPADLNAYVAQAHATWDHYTKDNSVWQRPFVDTPDELNAVDGS